MHPDKSLKRMLHSRDRKRMHMWLVALCSLTTDAKALDSQPHAHDAPVPACGEIGGTDRVPAGAWGGGGGQESMVNAAARALAPALPSCRRTEGGVEREGKAGGGATAWKGGRAGGG